MALVVDGQNSGDSSYTNMAPSYEGIAFLAACDLALEGRKQPSGYTEPILHSRRLKFKSWIGGVNIYSKYLLPTKTWLKYLKIFFCVWIGSVIGKV